MVKPMLQLIDIEKNFPGVRALDRARLSIYPGRVMALMGENGAGKSTLMKVLTGAHRMDKGVIKYRGKPVSFKGPRSSQEAGISIIHQELNLIPELTVAENIYLGREFVSTVGRIKWKKMFQEADKILKSLNLKFSSKTLLGNLGLGERQMVEIAKALSIEARVIIMDEPTDTLTEKETESLFRVINELREQGCGIVYISHRLKEIFEICNDVTVLRDGKFIGEYDVSDISENSLIEKMVGRQLRDQYPRIPAAHDEISLEVNGLAGSGLHDITFTLNRGEILGVSGLIGAGRTELMKAIYGALPIECGTISVGKRVVSPTSPKEGLVNGIAYISEDRKGDGLILGLSVKENMSLCALHKLSGGLQIRHSEEVALVESFIRLFNIKPPHKDQMVVHLSGGNQQKVAIAKGLITRPKILILDEPTRGVDVGAKKEIYQLINRLKADGMSIILVSSEMPEILGMSDRIIVMHAGRITGEFDPKNASQEKILACAVGKNIREEAA